MNAIRWHSHFFLVRVLKSTFAVIREKSSISVPLLQPAGTFGALRGFWGVPRQQEEHVRVFCDAERADGVLGPS